MLVRFFRFTGLILHGPVTFCAGLFTFLVLLLFVLNGMIFVDARGHCLRPGRVNMRPLGPITLELIELTSDEHWAKKPKKRARIYKLNEMLGHPDFVDQPQPTHISIPYRIRAK
jgi:hypothetical protein